MNRTRIIPIIPITQITPFAVCCFLLILILTGCPHDPPIPPPVPVPASPVLATPENDLASRPVLLTLRWHRSQDAKSYQIQVGQDAVFASLLTDVSGVTDTTKRVGPLLPSTQYFWHVRAAGAKANSDWSATWKFTTAGPWEFPQSNKFALALYSDGTSYAVGDSFDVKVVAYNLQDVFGAAFQVDYPHNQIGIGKIVYNPTAFADPQSVLTIQEIESGMDRVSIGFTFLRNSGRSINGSAVLLKLRCRAFTPGVAHLSFDSLTLAVTKTNGELIDTVSLEKDPLDLVLEASP